MHLYMSPSKTPHPREAEFPFAEVTRTKSQMGGGNITTSGTLRGPGAGALLHFPPQGSVRAVRGLLPEHRPDPPLLAER